MTDDLRWSPARQRALETRPLIALNFHEVPLEWRPQARERIADLLRFGPGLDLDRLDEPAEGPRVVIGWYDGWRDTALFGADVCAELGVRAFFFPITRPQRSGRGTLTADDLADIATAHEVGFHTATHRSAPTITRANLRAEVDRPMAEIERATGRRPRVAAWLLGSRYDPESLGNQRLRELGVEFMVSNWSLERIP
ncbi:MULTISPECIES: polysaccharide deacetylase family protein [Actinomycetes]|uniref:polysaccharide deacetylase family protein n=1 Tax=Actinomycetes TaxID=1760 RepID=UPI00142D7EE7|nr:MULTISPECIES: polysaccharide deacetylase family protein [Actinomycetes]